MPKLIRVYKLLIRHFLSNDLTGEEFSLSFMQLFLKEGVGMRQDYFNILQNLFEDCDAYDPDWTQADEEKFFYRITESTLRQEAQTALDELALLDQQQHN